MDILKSKSKGIRFILLMVFVLLSGISFYTNINKFIVVAGAIINILLYLYILEEPKRFGFFKSWVKKGIVAILTIVILFILFQFYEPPYFSTRIDNFLFFLLAFIPEEFFAAAISIKE